MNSKKNCKDPDFNGVYGQIASEHGTTPTEVIKEMQIVLDAAWNNPDAAARQKQRELFPKGKPTVEEFIRKISELAKGR